MSLTRGERGTGGSAQILVFGIRVSGGSRSQDRDFQSIHSWSTLMAASHFRRDNTQLQEDIQAGGDLNQLPSAAAKGNGTAE